MGCGLGWTVGKKGLGQLWATFEARFFSFSGSKFFKIFFWKHHSVGTEKLNWKKVKKEKKFGGEFFFQKNHIFLGLKMPLYVHWGREQTTVGYTVIGIILFCMGIKAPLLSNRTHSTYYNQETQIENEGLKIFFHIPFSDWSHISSRKRHIMQQRKRTSILCKNWCLHQFGGAKFLFEHFGQWYLQSSLWVPLS